jgi:hypothetical protein
LIVAGCWASCSVYPGKFHADIHIAIHQAKTDNHRLTDEMRDRYTKQFAKLDNKEIYFSTWQARKDDSKNSGRKS